MAVQAQYPSNILLLNSRNEQEERDYSLQPQSGGFFDQSHMLFNNGATTANSRKRGREITAGNPFFLQSQSPQLIDLSQLHNQQQNVVSTGLRLSFGDQHQQQQQRIQLQQQQQQNGCHSSSFLSLLSEGFVSQIKQERDEIDQFLHAQKEQLRRILLDSRHRHYHALLNAAEESVARRLREKEADVEKATRKNAELEARAAQLSVEAQFWQAKVKAQEATAATLQTQLQQAIMSGGGGGVTEDGGLTYASGGVEGQAEDAESAYIDPDRVVESVPKCRGCGKQVASVVVLPCRHLCICTECDKHYRVCPVCLAVKNSTVEVYLS
ncbi:BOI-related E3 ubiquitin-protein ligase 1 [Quillaja saponaria]|uniref:BOI-related E3 ubiquitin-protein ligase 1 n=1 Tax=Quillaja saponaria TaxID=32244 RepID=A0AAD7P772_QUISA|nr:BOI-related E3 ubiquitin-protein ligase 1 [Quillaja saponaria]